MNTFNDFTFNCCICPSKFYGLKQLNEFLEETNLVAINKKRSNLITAFVENEISSEEENIRKCKRRTFKYG